MHAPAATASLNLPADDSSGDFSPFLHRKGITTPQSGRFGFAVLLLATAALLIRPADLFPTLEHWTIYQSVILIAGLLSVRRIVHQLMANVRARAITQLMLAFGAMIVLSHLLRGNIYFARIGGFEFFKVIIYYLIVLSCIDTIARLRLFLLGLCAFTLVLTMLSIGEYHGLLDIPTLASVHQSDVSGGEGTIRRLVGTGIFNDPNDLCLLLVVAIGCCFCFYVATPSRLLKLGLWLPIGVLGYAITLTYSRGGLLALLGGAMIALSAKIGRARTALYALAAAPLLLVGLSGRQTHVDLSNPGDTFQTRLDLWGDSLTLFRGSPLIGTGHDRQVDYSGQVAHNTYLQNFAELGFVGGACFLGMLIFCMQGVARIDLRRADRTLLLFRPFLLGAIGGYAIGLLSLSRGYTISTYLVIAIGAAFINLAPAGHPLQLDSRALRRLSYWSVLVLVAMYLFVRVMNARG